eukprot:7204976-Prorocentrum_lima.AAC.1
MHYIPAQRNTHGECQHGPATAQEASGGTGGPVGDIAEQAREGLPHSSRILQSSGGSQATFQRA